ncbi:MAG: TonB family protein [Bacteroidales bacterium]|nr:TonB family protein [Bacteroidales bacterium]MBN2758236.1 TonB family protein [Bacteroidales bacterium]
MKNKKNEKVDLDKKRGLFLQIGFIIAFSLMLYAFEWATPHLTYNKSDNIAGINIETDVITITRQVEIKPPAPKHFSQIKLIPDDKKEVKQIEIPTFEVEPDDNIYSDFDSPDEIESDPIIVDFAEQMPEFPGGIIGLKHFIAKNIKYPTQAIEEDIQGKVYIRFVVNTKGETKQVSVIRSVDPILDKEALRVVKSFPNWKPAKQSGKAVNVWYTIPIVFKIN